MQRAARHAGCSDRIGITQLQKEGRLELDDHIARYLPDYPDPEIARKVTIQQLLDMSSGFGDIFGERFDATPKDEIIDLSDYLNLFAGKPLESHWDSGWTIVVLANLDPPAAMRLARSLREILGLSRD